LKEAGVSDNVVGSFMPEHEIQIEEMRFPAVSGSAFATARESVLNSGQSVLQSEEGVIYEVFPDGRRIARKEIAPPSQYVTGQVFSIQ
jgi:hypothetical protein